MRKLRQRDVESIMKAVGKIAEIIKPFKINNANMILRISSILYVERTE